MAKEVADLAGFNSASTARSEPAHTEHTVGGLKNDSLHLQLTARDVHLSHDWHVGYSRLVCRDKGVLYEDGQLRIS